MNVQGRTVADIWQYDTSDALSSYHIFQDWL